MCNVKSNSVRCTQTLLVCLCLSLLFLPTLLHAKQVRFSSPFTLQQKHGKTLFLNSLEEDGDQKGGVIYIYETTDGIEGFTTPSNVANLAAVKNALYPSHASPAPSPRETISSHRKEYIPAAAPAQIDAKTVVAVLNSRYGTVCKARLKGFLNKRLVIDWTGYTNKLHVMTIFAEVGSVKEDLYRDGVRYFQFPNDAGTYNVIDWKTGEKESISDRAPYYFTH